MLCTFLLQTTPINTNKKHKNTNFLIIANNKVFSLIQEHRLFSYLLLFTKDVFTIQDAEDNKTFMVDFTKYFFCDCIDAPCIHNFFLFNDYVLNNETLDNEHTTILLQIAKNYASDKTEGQILASLTY